MLRLGARLGAVARRGALGLRRPPLSTMPSAVTGGVLGPPMAPLRARGGGGSLRSDSGSSLFRLAMASIKPLQKTSTDAPMFKYNPTSPGRRHRLIVSKKGLWKGRPHQKLTMRIKSHAGRNNTGQITVRGRQAPHHRRLYRLVDFKRQRKDPAVVERFEYDPNRSGFIALIRYVSDGTPSYILAPNGLEEGKVLQCGEGAPFEVGNAMPLSVIPDGFDIHNIELKPGTPCPYNPHPHPNLTPTPALALSLSLTLTLAQILTTTLTPTFTRLRRQARARRWYDCASHLQGGTVRAAQAHLGYMATLTITLTMATLTMAMLTGTCCSSSPRARCARCSATATPPLAR